MVINKTHLFFLVMFTITNGSESILTCQKNSDCDDLYACISYTSCDAAGGKKQIKQCLPRSCYRSGIDCPVHVYCQQKHCADLRCTKHLN